MHLWFHRSDLRREMSDTITYFLISMSTLWSEDFLGPGPLRVSLRFLSTNKPSVERLASA